MIVKRSLHALRLMGASLLLMSATLSATHAQAPADYGKTHELVVALPYALQTLDPAVGGNLRGDLSIIASIYSPLTRLDGEGKLVGVLAKDWKQESDTRWVFDLRDDVVFSNNVPFDAHVVKWNIERILSSEKPSWIVSSMKAVDKVEVLSPHQVAFTLQAPDIEFPKRLAGIFYLEPEWAKSHNPAIEALGTGPYKLVSYNPEGEVRLEANEHYFGKAAPFSTAQFRVVVDAAAKINGLKSGEIDAAAVIAPQDLAQLESNGNLVAGARPSTRVQIIRFNTNIKPLDDARVRQALNYAIDKEAITKALFKGLVSPANSQIITSFHEGYNTDLKPWPYDPEKAKALLAEAGYPDGFDVEMVFGKGTYVGGEQAAQIIAAQLAAVGVRAQLNILPASSHAERAASDKAAGLTWFGYADTASIAAETLTYLGSTHFQTIGPVPAAFDEAVKQAKGALTKDAELASVKRATEVASDEALAVFLWDLPQTYAYSNKVVWDIRRDDWTLPYEIKPAE
ncbi:ABC transporter substrate-binding protein [Brucella pseudogrignonensis]|uniref:ABC transporter substrate-binding protein n=1 Tax=Brucella pseudogrignonensis TaxID=419475 RepID=UPI000CFE1593|nr:ABC transporter substrate-binding protein [Brucella pseudogrignonensis]MQP42707.1 hypothetical protein [Ochrobactrum sp. MYb237]PQZ41124.1 hypothetical protein CQ059_17985 [Brucella pseudogrignonensis]PRA37422.1 hypothetical protein CQ063_21155 [Brucella pseudogrignonensis]PRA62328.1 hypothetical protein CQ055_21935 [Brucella pseudogrignonensis]